MIDSSLGAEPMGHGLSRTDTSHHVLYGGDGRTKSWRFHALLDLGAPNKGASRVCLSNKASRPQSQVKVTCNCDLRRAQTRLASQSPRLQPPSARPRLQIPFVCSLPRCGLPIVFGQMRGEGRFEGVLRAANNGIPTPPEGHPIQCANHKPVRLFNARPDFSLDISVL